MRLIHEDIFKAPDYDDRQNDVPVLVNLELTAQPLRKLPDLAGEVVELLFLSERAMTIDHVLLELATRKMGFPRILRFSLPTEQDLTEEKRNPSVREPSRWLTYDRFDNFLRGAGSDIARIVL
jgi:hypothetical protein